MGPFCVLDGWWLTTRATSPLLAALPLACAVGALVVAVIGASLVAGPSTRLAGIQVDKFRTSSKMLRIAKCWREVFFSKQSSKKESP